MTRHFITGIGIVGAVASVVALAFIKEVRHFLGGDFTVPLWVYLATIAASVIVTRVLGRRAAALPRHSTASSHILINEAPKLVATRRSVDALGTGVLRGPRGTFSTWVYLDKMDYGIRRLVNNRYILACTTAPNPPYRNVLALCHGPLKNYHPPEDPSWKVSLQS
jgi:hypothetical protein